MVRAIPLLVSAGLLWPAVCGAWSPELTPEQWREDVAHLAEELERIHPGVFDRVSRDSFRTAVHELMGDVPSLRPDQIQVRMMQIVALIPDAHTSPSTGNRAVPTDRIFPIRFDELEGGLFVTAVDPARRDILGAEVVAIGSTPIDEALERVGSTIPGESEFSLQRKRAYHLVLPVLLHGLDLIENPEVLPIELRGRDGERRALELSAIEWDGRSDWYKRSFGAPVDSFLTLYDVAAGPLPVSLAHEGEIRGGRRHYWLQWLPERRAVYVRFNRVRAMDDESLDKFWSRMWAEVDDRQADRLVVDLRYNTGGNNFLVKPLIHGVIKRDRINRTGALFVLISPNTFSAAVSTAAWLENETNAVFVGSPTGQRPNLYSEPTVVGTPHSGFRAEVSQYQWVHTVPWDERLSLPPDIAVFESVEDRLAGRDPAFELVRELDEYRSIEDVVRAALDDGGGETARLRYREYKARYPDVWKTTAPAMTELLFTLMNEGRLEDAIVVGRLNTETYPDDVEAWDWLGEAYLAAEQVERAKSCYRSALSIDPENSHAQRRLASLE